MPLTRRDFAKQSAYTGAGVALVGTVDMLATAPGALAAEGAGERGHRPSLGYGPLVPDPKGLLALPAGFSYRVITRSGETTLESGESTPSNHDGTPTFEGPRGTTLLVNNHELSGPRSKWAHPVPLVEGLVYDRAASGGCTVVEVSRHGDHVSEWVGIAGTATNCAGGRTPWGTWLTCEETDDKAGENGMTKDHGYVFEVDPHDRPRRHRAEAEGAHAQRGPKPIKALGRYAHEAVVVDPRRGHFYLTEDADEPNGLFYRWVPPRGLTPRRRALRHLADDAGVLQAPQCYDSGGRFVDDLSRARKVGTVYGVYWIDVPDRDAQRVPVRKQFQGPPGHAGAQAGGHVVGGRRGVYRGLLRPRREPGRSRRPALVLRPAPPHAHPEGAARRGPGPGQRRRLRRPGQHHRLPVRGLIIAEDGDGVQHLFGATDRGETYPIARNELNIGTAEKPSYSEFTGVVFSPDGYTL